MPGSARRIRVSLWAFVIVLVIVLLAVDGEVSRAAALDRWVGTAVLSASGVTLPVNFTVLVNPGIGASWEWRFQGVQLASGFLSANVSGSTVNGTLFITGGAIFDPGLCCAPCNFSGSIAGNRVDGTLDRASCGEDGGTFVLVKQ